jgi:2-polyprenyl-3-methyl-5-hydroxy-6-metoxy-1,4-benzoquinol methylase
MSSVVFDKYEAMGAYHWRECDPRSLEYNPPLVARYSMIANRVNGGDVLDLGAGDGYLASLVAHKCRFVTALEYEPTGVELSRKMLAGYDNVAVAQGSAYSLSFAASSFDTVLLADVIEHLEEPKLVVAEMARVLRNDGVALVTTPKWRPDRVWDPRHVKEYKPGELLDLMHTAFGVVEMRYAWPRRWSDFYRSRTGWRLLKLAGRVGYNPFLIEGEAPEDFCQMLAIARRPNRPAAP